MLAWPILSSPPTSDGTLADLELARLPSPDEVSLSVIRRGTKTDGEWGSTV
jgi:hypothetical protein